MYFMIQWWWLIPAFAVGAVAGIAIIYAFGKVWGNIEEAIRKSRPSI